VPVIVPGASQQSVPGSGPRIVAVPDPGANPPAMRLSVAGMGASADVRIVRVDPDGRTRPVRQAEPLRVSAQGNGFCDDHEMPHNAPVRYRVSGTVASTDPVQVDSEDVWLIDPGRPDGSVRFPTTRLLELGNLDYPVRGVITEVQGRPDSIVTVMGNDVGAPTSTLTVRTDTEADGWAMRSLVRTAGVVMLQVPRHSGQRPLWDYVWLSTRGEQYVAKGTKPALRWPLAYRVTGRPEGAQNALWDWSGAETTYTGWDELAAAYPGGWNDFTVDRREFLAP